MIRQPLPCRARTRPPLRWAAAAALLACAAPALAEDSVAEGSVAEAALPAEAAPLGRTDASRPLPDAPSTAPVVVERWTLPDRALAPARLSSDAPTYGPAGTVSADARRPDPGRYDSFGERVGAVKWELGAFAAYFVAANVKKVIEEPQSFRFQDEGLFGRDTNNLGVDKLAHAWNTYLISDILYLRMERRTGGGRASALTAAALGSGLQTFGEVFDGLHEGSGFSVQDMAFNLAGAGFSVLRNSNPDLKRKVDFRLLIVPNSDIYTFSGKRHFEQQKFFAAFKLAGFDALARSPLRFVELHAGYSARDFTNEDRAAGVTPKRRIFAGVGLNFTELFFRDARHPVGQAAATVLQYYQLPYTSLRTD